MSVRRLLLAILATMVLLAGCASSGDTTATSGLRPSPGTPSTSVPAASEGGWIDADGPLEWSGGGDAEMGGPMPTGVALAEAGDGATEEARIDGAEPPGVPGPVPPPVEVGLRAGWVDDNEAWEDYLLYRQQFDTLGIPIRPIAVEGRRIITVTDGTGRPVLGARVVITDEGGAVVHDTLTSAAGRTLFFAPPRRGDPQQRTPAWTATVTKAGIDSETALDPERLAHDVVLEGVPTTDLRLDVLFLIDATGSMGDEIERLKANMVSVAEQISSLPASPDLRLAMTVYRDHGDLFVTRTFEFTSDVAAFVAALREVVAEGGGDYPEALDEAVTEAVTLPAWRVEDTVSLVFLVADAPPHIGDGSPATGADYTTALVEARRKGIKVFPIAASGTDAQAEYVFRQMAQVTDAPFVFLTYGADGISPGEGTTMNVDDYSVLALDELIVELVADELAQLVR